MFNESNEMAGYSAGNPNANGVENLEVKNRVPAILSKAATTLAVLVAALIDLYYLYLYLVGVPTVVTVEGQATESVQFVPASQAFVPTLAATLIFAGILSRRMWAAWIGLGILIVFSVLFFFGIGGILMPVSGLLVTLLLIISFFRRDRPLPTVVE